MITDRTKTLRNEIVVRLTDAQLELMAETGLSRDKQRTARKALRTRELLEERYDRLDHQLYFRVNVEAYNALVQRMYDAVDDSDEQPKSLKLNQIRKGSLAYMEIVYRQIRKPYIASAEIPETSTEKNPVAGARNRRRHAAFTAASNCSAPMSNSVRRMPAVRCVRRGM